MQKVTVAIADKDPARYARLEQSLQGEQDIKVLASVIHGGKAPSADQQQLDSNVGMAGFEDVIARIGRLRPRILFVDLDQSTGGFALLETLHREYPETLMVLLTDKSAEDEQIIQALANGVRGYLDHEAAPSYFLKAVRMVDQGEVWVTRKMLGKIMDKIVH